MPTPHNSAAKGDFARTVLMPGDPLRARYIAENFLENPVLVNDVRGVQGYTGTWKGARVSVQASGMGIPSIGIYAWELYTQYDVENIIRVGSAGGLNNTAVGICGFVLPVIVANFVGDNYTMIFTLMAIFLVIIAIVGGVLMPELGEKGKLAQQAKKEQP